MVPPRTRLVRRAPLMERLKAYISPWDFLLSLSEEINSSDWEDFQKDWAVPIGFGLNVVFMIARANATSRESYKGDDVFGDYYEGAGSGWTVWLASFVVHLLTMLSLLNAAYTFLRRRHYRLFEVPIDTVPSTPSAHRVRVESSPISSSPFRFLTTLIAESAVFSRAHPDASRDVWELAVWDPTPICLRLFCMLSPGHILIYWLFLPVSPRDLQPSVTVVTAMVLAALLSGQLMLLRSFFSQQSKDSALIQKEVLHEYDTKFVHPSLNKVVREVSTQTPSDWKSKSCPEVLASTPTTYVNRGFHPNPNPAYATHYDPDNANNSQNVLAHRISRAVTTPDLRTPLPDSAIDYSSPFRPTPNLPPMRQPSFTATSRSPAKDDAGSFGIYNHARSPLKKGIALTNAANPSFGRIRGMSPPKREGSPLKRSSTPGGYQVNGSALPKQRLGQFRSDENRRESTRY